MAVPKRFLRSSVNWANFAERVPPYDKGKFLQFKAKTDGYVKKLMNYPEKPPEIDWSVYRSRISPALVDDFQKKYAAVKIPYPPDTKSAEIDVQHKRMAERMKNDDEISDLKIKLYERKLGWWKSMMPFDEMSMDDLADYFPDETYEKTKNNWPGKSGPPEPDFPYGPHAKPSVH